MHLVSHFTMNFKHFEGKIFGVFVNFLLHIPHSHGIRRVAVFFFVRFFTVLISSFDNQSHK